MKRQRKIEPKHVQARLGIDNPDEYEALQVFFAWLDAGYDQREILTNALRVLGEHPLPEPKGAVSQSALRSALEAALGGMQEVFAEIMGKVLDERMDEFAAMTPAQRKREIREATGSSFRSSIMNSVDVAEYEDDDQ